ncbi:hypothetical protein EV662_102430 [Rhodovulum marinum]|uniref:Uncharacterized protein n=1 Tax=Rhodovulum marinum TaxID=320662 RepID=A0A4R2Q3C0_9RHOB|nr:hypothetical protein EV662_102430 [Rhodovulum marinum]
MNGRGAVEQDPAGFASLREATGGRGLTPPARFADATPRAPCDKARRRKRGQRPATIILPAGCRRCPARPLPSTAHRTPAPHSPAKLPTRRPHGRGRQPPAPVAPAQPGRNPKGRPDRRRTRDREPATSIPPARHLRSPARPLRLDSPQNTRPELPGKTADPPPPRPGAPAPGPGRPGAAGAKPEGTDRARNTGGAMPVRQSMRRRGPGPDTILRWASPAACRIGKASPALDGALRTAMERRS